MGALTRGLRILDEIQHLAQLEAFEPTAFVAAIGDETLAVGEALAEVGGQLDAVRALLPEIDRFAQKSMRIRLAQLADPLPQQLRTLLCSTIVAYEHDLPLLRTRVAGMLARLDRATAAASTEAVMQAAERALAVRAVLRQGVLELAQRLATAWLPAARRAARVRSQADEERERWGRAAVDLERLAARGETLDDGNFADRLEKITEPAADADAAAAESPDPTATRFSLIEID